MDVPPGLVMIATFAGMSWNSRVDLHYGLHLITWRGKNGVASIPYTLVLDLSSQESVRDL